MTSSSVKNQITLRGSAEIVTEFFNYGINSIIFQRGIYPPETFTRAEQYGLIILVTEDEKLKAFISNVLSQLKKWLLTKEVHRVVVVISDCNSKETLERWEFRIECDGEFDERGEPKAKDIKEIQKEIRNIIRQITASVTFLPFLDSACTFDVLLYTNKDLEVPDEWAESTAHLIPDCQEICLCNFSTSVHKVAPSVQYKTND